MKKYINPLPSDWEKLIERPSIDKKSLDSSVLEILKSVKENGDSALIEYTEKFDRAKIDSLVVNNREVVDAEEMVGEDLKEAIQLAKHNIEVFHRSQKQSEPVVEVSPGVKCWRKSIPIEKVGLYIPGGSAPLFSSILMLGIPAKIAGCKEIIICTPPSNDGTINPIILYTAKLLGISKVYKTGGAQAIAAMAYGTETIPAVSKIFGPGNQFVTRAKELVQQDGLAIDMPAGPSEVLVIADNSAVPKFVAADLLSQAEHGADSQVVLLSDNEEVVENCLQELEKQLKVLPRKDVASKALENSTAIVLNSMGDCMALSNLYAPEHLILASEKANDLVEDVVNAGSVFIGNYSCESAGDYASGTNHTLPTNGFARAYSGVSLDSFVKKVTFQELNKTGIATIGRAIELMAEAEGLYAHKNAVTVRLKSIENV